MDIVTRFFASGFFHESVSPQPQSIPLGPFKIFAKIHGDMRKPRSTTPVANLPTVSTTPLAKLPPVSSTPVSNLPPVSMTPAENFSTSFASVVDTGGKFDRCQRRRWKSATSINHTDGKFATNDKDTGGK